MQTLPHEKDSSRPEEKDLNALGWTMLKPCPFCGQPAELLHDHSGYLRNVAVMCTKCSAIGEWADTDDKAVMLWNRRAHQETSDD
jgi:Lar family restriction alleviation protein